MHKKKRKGLSLLQDQAIFREVEMINVFKRGNRFSFPAAHCSKQELLQLYPCEEA